MRIMSTPLPSCENCGRTIGRLEKQYTWENHVVCHECFTRLAAQSGVAAPAAPPSAAAAAPTAPAAHAELSAVPPESVLFDGHPSLLGELPYFSAASMIGVLGVVLLILAAFTRGWVAYCGLLLLLMAGVMWLGKYLALRFVHYRLSSQRLFITTGILNKKTVEIELFRVRDLSVDQTFLQRMLGIGSIYAVSTDSDVPRLSFFGIRDPLRIKELLRQHVMESRQRTRTRDLDIADLPGTM